MSDGAQAQIHPTAIVEPGAVLGDGVLVGPFCRVGAGVRIGERAQLMSHVSIEGATRLGAEAVVFPFASLGAPPQHLGHKGEETRLEIGDQVVIREHVTMNPGTVAGGGVTRIGDRGYFMVGAHIAHDCEIGDDVIFANNATLGGHVKVGERAFLGGLCAVHQHCRIGDFAFVGGCAAVSGDVIPYASAFGNHARLGGLNVIGMKRRGMARETIRALRSLYQELFEGAGTFRDRVARARSSREEAPECARILDFVEADAPRPLMTPAAG